MLQHLAVYITLCDLASNMSPKFLITVGLVAMLVSGVYAYVTGMWGCGKECQTGSIFFWISPLVTVVGIAMLAVRRPRTGSPK